jgi:hypothetical protein
MFPLMAAAGLLTWWSETLRVEALVVAAAWLVMGRVVIPRLRPRECSVTIEPGAITLENAGLAAQRIEARDLRAASTSRLSDGACALALVRHEEGDPVLWLELASRAEIDRVRQALGIRHGGFGMLRWPPAQGTYHSVPTRVDVAASLGWLAILVAVLFQATEVALGFALFTVPLTLVAMVMATRPRPVGRGLAMTPHGLELALDGRASFLPWSEVVDAEVQGTELCLRTRTGTEALSMREAQASEREHVAAQIRSSARRARGEGPPPPEVPASLEVLAPRNEGRRAWLERIDATAASMAEASGYRQAGVAPSELWAVLESPDAPTYLRAAAARVLARVAPEEAGKRIGDALAMEHDGDARVRIQVALEEDVDVAARELERLDLRR